eukprot:GHVH01017126.1.p1 GENE.GHVH01017126.1~~GHVH01017126.1.p1  ORF type:complete len:510 (+),score=63.74 GHVH01017126.1:198-1727(+)
MYEPKQDGLIKRDYLPEDMNSHQQPSQGGPGSRQGNEGESVWGDTAIRDSPTPAARPDDVAERKVFLGGLNYDSTPETISAVLQSDFGPVENIEIITDRYSGLSRGFGFAIFRDSSVADRVVRSNNITIDGSRVEVRKAQPKGVVSRPSYERTASAPPKRAAPSAVSNDGKVFVGGLSFNTTEDELNSYFSQFGRINYCEIMMNKTTNQPRGFGFVTFELPEDAAATVGRHPSIGKSVEVKLALPKVDSQPPYAYSGGHPHSGGGHPSSYGSGGDTSPPNYCSPYDQPHSYREDEYREDCRTVGMNGYGGGSPHRYPSGGSPPYGYGNPPPGGPVRTVASSAPYTPNDYNSYSGVAPSYAPTAAQPYGGSAPMKPRAYPSEERVTEGGGQRTPYGSYHRLDGPMYPPTELFDAYPVSPPPGRMTDPRQVSGMSYNSPQDSINPSGYSPYSPPPQQQQQQQGRPGPNPNSTQPAGNYGSYSAYGSYGGSPNRGIPRGGGGGGGGGGSTMY